MKKLYHTIRESFVAMLRQGLSPKELSLAVASGATISLFPVPGTTTLLCLAAARVAGLNIVVSQAANWLASPLQVLLLVPFMRAGALLLGIDDSVLSTGMVDRIAEQGLLPVAGALGLLVPAAIVAWAVAAGPVFLILYGISRVAFRRSAPAVSLQVDSPTGR